MPKMTNRLKRLTARVDAALAEALKPRDGAPVMLYEAMAYCVSGGGKRFRPLLCLGGSLAVGGSPAQTLPVACAIELIHTYSLVHDDLPAMDNADERRGRPACHKRFGEAEAILVGDALLTRSFELLASSRLPNAPAVLRALGRASGTEGLIGGQVLDLAHSRQHTPARRIVLAPGRAAHRAKKIEEIAKRKTGALIRASVVAGGLAGGADRAALNRLSRYGERLGLAFQLVDDLHDRDGAVAVVGEQRVRQRAERCIAQAMQQVEPWGRRAWLLTALAEWLTRNANDTTA
ncbi:MAG: polyprenyl synthetase family protein [Candidatus Omnitrophica bacterium]|nr:polyprenyl synthetase family protein [Candidatus Omnitrophota bacterium]